MMLFMSKHACGLSKEKALQNVHNRSGTDCPRNESEVVECGIEGYTASKMYRDGKNEANLTGGRSRQLQCLFILAVLAHIAHPPES